MKTSILLADDHQVIIDGLKALLSGEPDMEVIGQATDGLQVLPKVLELKPEIIVLDLMMPGLGGLEVARQLRDRAPATKVIILSMHSNDAYVVEALRNGAAG
jgi:two-component system, NarL family, response regulator NreC